MADRFVTVDSETYALPAPVVDALVGALPPGGGELESYSQVSGLVDYPETFPPDPSALEGFATLDDLPTEPADIGAQPAIRIFPDEEAVASALGADEITVGDIVGVEE